MLRALLISAGAENNMMSALVARIRIPSLTTLVLLTCGWTTSTLADQYGWSQRFSGYGAIGMGNMDASPDTGGNITMSFSDTTAPGVSTRAMVGGSGRESTNYMPYGTLGVRFNPIDTLKVGLERHRVSFSDSVSTTPRVSPTIPATGTNFGTYRETSDIKVEATDLVATASYARWGVTVEGLYGNREGSFNSEAEMQAFGVFTTGNFVNLYLANGSSFSGDGNVKGLSLSYKIPHVFTLYHRYKWSTLDGTSDSYGRVTGTVASSPSAPLVGAATVRRNNAVAEAEIRDYEHGVQYDFKQSPGTKTQSFVRLSYIKSTWDINGLPTGGAGFGGTIGELTTNSFSSAGLGGVTLRGYSLAIGAEF